MLIPTYPTQASSSLNSPYVEIDVLYDGEVTFSGSGTSIGNGYIVTAAHVVEGFENTLTVKLHDGTKLEATVTTINHTYDFAVIRVDKVIDSAAMNCDIPAVGTKLKMHGNLGGIPYIYTTGEVVGEPLTYGPWAVVLPVDGQLIWGMSGGGAFNEDNELVGLNVGLYIFPSYNEPMAFAFIVPVHYVCNQLSSLDISV